MSSCAMDMNKEAIACTHNGCQAKSRLPSRQLCRARRPVGGLAVPMIEKLTHARDALRGHVRTAGGALRCKRRSYVSCIRQSRYLASFKVSPHRNLARPIANLECRRSSEPMPTYSVECVPLPARSQSYKLPRPASRK
eukprot:6208123-Pleurochrysis_carterae.AAC.1